MTETIERPTNTIGGQIGFEFKLGRFFDFSAFGRPSTLNTNEIDKVRLELGAFKNQFLVTPAIRVNGSSDGVAIDFGFLSGTETEGKLLTGKAGGFFGLRFLGLADGTNKVQLVFSGSAGFKSFPASGIYGAKTFDLFTIAPEERDDTFNWGFEPEDTEPLQTTFNGIAGALSELEISDADAAQSFDLFANDFESLFSSATAQADWQALENETQNNLSVEFSDTPSTSGLFESLSIYTEDIYQGAGEANYGDFFSGVAADLEASGWDSVDDISFESDGSAYVFGTQNGNSVAATFSPPREDGSFDYYTETFDEDGQIISFEEQTSDGEVILHGYVTTIHNPDGTTSVVTTREGTEEENNIVWKTAVVTRSGPTPEQQSLITRHQGAANIGALFGSTLGSVIGGDNVFARVAASTVLSTVLSHVASNIFQSANAAEIVQQGVDQALDAQLPGLASTFQSQAIGAISSFLTGELSEALDIGDNFGGALFSYAGNTAISTVLNNIANNKDLFFNFGGQLINSPQALANLGAFVGGYLGNQVVAPETQAGSVLGSLGGTLGAAIGAGIAGISSGFLGSIGGTILTGLGLGSLIGTITGTFANFLLPGIGAFIGTILGNIIGDFLSDIFGWDDGPDSFWGLQPVTYDYNTGVYKRGQIEIDHDITNTDINNLENMADSAINVLNRYMDTVGGTVVSARAPSFYMAWTASQQYFRIEAYTAEGTYSNSTGNGHVEKAILATLKNVKIKGGDPYLKRILAKSQATTLEQLNGEMQLAADYAAYVKNKQVIDAIISQDSQSAFAAANDNTQTLTARRMAA